jgi:hypothetical protein
VRKGELVTTSPKSTDGGSVKAAAHRGLFVALLLLTGAAAHAIEVRFDRVAEGVYAHIGDKGPRTVDDEGLNANIGLVVTRDDAVLIDSGAALQSARQIHDAVKTLTPQPVRWVINTGGQDHRWLGNGDFAAQGAEIIAHAGARPDMVSRGDDQLQALRAALGARADGTAPALPTRVLTGNDERLELGGVVFEFKHRGGAHTPGDTQAYPLALRAHMRKAVDAAAFTRLLNAAELMPGNASRIYLELERE